MQYVKKIINKIKNLQKLCHFLKVWYKDPYEQINKDDNKNAKVKRGCISKIKCCSAN